MSETEQLGVGNLGDLVGILKKLPEILDQLKELRELVPIILDIIECVKSMAPQDRERVARIVARLADDEETARRVTEALTA